MTDACKCCQQADVRSFFRALELLPMVKFNSHHTIGLGLDMTIVDKLTTALNLIARIYQRIQQARSEAKGYGISKQRKLILELAVWVEQQPVLKHYQLGNTFRSFEKKLGLHDYPIRDLGFRVAQSILTVQIEFLTLAEHHIMARIRDLEAAQALCRSEITGNLCDMSQCLTIGHQLVTDLEAGCISKKHMPKLLKQLTNNDVGLMHLIQSEQIARVKKDFEHSFSRRYASQRNVINVCAHLLMAASLWYSLARSHPLSKTSQLTKPLTRQQRLSDLNYLDKRNQALKA